MTRGDLDLRPGAEAMAREELDLQPGEEAAMRSWASMLDSTTRC
jgi:hypothetical protein